MPGCNFGCVHRRFASLLLALPEAQELPAASTASATASDATRASPGPVLFVPQSQRRPPSPSPGDGHLL